MTLWSDFKARCAFQTAYTFYDTTNSQEYQYEKHPLENIGGWLRAPVGIPTNKFLQEIKNPLVILSMVALAGSAITIAFYPREFFHTVKVIVPFVEQVKPWMVKATLWIIGEATILGIGLRALGRERNPALVAAWKANQIIPLHLGARI